MSDDLELAISLVLDGSSNPESQRAFTEILGRLGKAAQEAGTRSGKDQAKAEAGGYAREAETAWRKATEPARRARQESAKQAAADARVNGRLVANAEVAAQRGLNNLLADYTRRRISGEKDTDKVRLQTQRASDSQKLAETQRANREALQQQRVADREDLIEVQSSAQRRTALIHAGLRIATTTYETGFRGIVAVIRAHAEKKASIESSSNSRSIEETRSTITRETSIIRTQLEEQGTVYTRAAQRRLATIERASASETRVITEASVRQTQAQLKAQERLSGGLAGAATGQGAAGNAIQTIAAYAGGGLLLRNIAQITTAEIKLQRQTDAVINSTGGVAEVSAKHVRDYSTELSALSGVSHQAITNAENILLTFRDIRNTSKGHIFDEATLSVLNLSVALKEDLKAASIQVGKALNDPIKGVTALRRVGVQFTQEQTDAIKILAEGGSSLKARELALKQAAKATDALAKAQHRLSDLELIDGSKKKLSISQLVTLRNAQQDVAKATLAAASASRFQGAVSQGLTGKIGAQKIILAELNKEFAGSAAAQSTAGDRFRETLHNIEEEIGLFFYPIIQTVLGGLSTLFNNLFHGEGQWKILRDGLIGVAAGLGAILAVKAAVEVLGLIASGIELIAASPTALAVTGLALLSGTVYTLFRNSKPVHDFFSSLVTGTKNWAEVGYKIDKPVKSLSTVVYLQTLMGSAARTTKDFFSSLVTGTRNWAEVGYKIDKPITSLSNIVLVQTSLGAAARGIVGSLGNIKAGLKDLFSGDVDAALREAHTVGDRLSTALRPLGGQIIKGLEIARHDVAEFLGGIFNGVSIGDTNASTARKLGAKLSHILGDAFATVRHDVAEFFGGIFNGEGTGSDPSVARKIGDRLRADVASAFRTVRSSVAGFFRGLFTDIKPLDPIEVLAGIKANDGGAAGRLGTRLRDLIKRGIHNIGPLVGTVGTVLGNIGHDVGKFLSDHIIPALVEIPYIVGKFLSRTAFSKQFLTFLRNTVIGLGSIAATIAIQFVLGFLKGIEERRGDIAKVLYSTLRGAVVLAIKGGPFGIIAGALIAAFIGGKVIGAIGTLRKTFGVATAGLTGDLGKTRDAARELRTEVGKVRGPGAGVGNAFLAIGRGIQGAKTGVSGIGNGFLALDGHLRDFGAKLQGLEGKALNSAGRVYDTTTGQFAERSKRRLADVQTFIGNGFVHVADGLRSAELRVGGFFSDGLSRAKSFINQFRTTSTDGLRRGSDEFAAAEARNVQVTENRMRGAQAVGASAASAIGAYFAAMSNDTTTKVVGIATTVASTLSIAAIDPVAGAVAAVAGVVGFVIGDAQKKSAALKRQALTDAQELAAETEKITSGFKSAFENNDFTTPAGKLRSAILTIQDLVKGGDRGSREFFSRFKGNIAEAAAAASRGAPGLKRYTDLLASRATSDALSGNRTAFKNFVAEVSAGSDAARNKADKFLEALAPPGAPPGKDFEAALANINRAFDGLNKGGSVAQFRKDLRGIGEDANGSNEIVDTLVSNVKKNIGVTAGGEFLRGLSPAFQQALKDQQILADAQDRLKTPAQKYADAWDNARQKIDDATTAYKDHLLAVQGGAQTLDQATIATIDAANSVNQTHGHQGDDARRREVIRGLQVNLADQLKALADQSGGNLKVYQDKVKFLSAYLVGQLSGPNGAFPKNKQAAQDFINTVLGTPDKKAFELLSNTAVETEKVKQLHVEIDKIPRHINLDWSLNPAVNPATTYGQGQTPGTGLGPPEPPPHHGSGGGFRSLMIGPGHHAVPVNRPPATPVIGPGPAAVPVGSSQTIWDVKIDARGHKEPVAVADETVRKLRNEEFLRTGGGITT